MNCPNNKRAWCMVLIQKANVMPSKAKLLNPNVILYAYKKSKQNSLMLNISRNYAPPFPDSFEFLPSVGVSGGSIIIWNGSKFIGSLAFQNDYAQSIELFVVSLENIGSKPTFMLRVRQKEK